LSQQQKIEELTQQLSALKNQKDKLNVEAREWAEKRNKLNEQFKSLRSEAFELKNERDKLNESVRELKQQRDGTRTEFREKIEEIRKSNQEIKALAKKEPSRSAQNLQKEFESIEWKIQTSSLSLNEEKELVERVKQLQTQLNIHRKLDRLNQKIIESKAELKALETKNRLFHEKLTENAQKSQKIHEKMLEKIDASKKLKTEADSLHKLFLQTRERAKPIQEEILEISNQIRGLKEEIRGEEDKEKKKIEEALREKLEKQAREKLRRGEKLTWEEFQLLAEKGVTAQD
jgi:uncharacterized coiled-coil DUF342 family protein